MFIYSTGPTPDYMHSVIHVHIFDWTTPWLYAFCYIHVHIFDWTNPWLYAFCYIHVHIFGWTTPWLYAFCYTCSYIRLDHPLTICILLYTCSYIRLDHPLTICILLYMFIYSTGPSPDYMHSVIHVHIFDWTTPWLYAFCYTCSYIRLDQPLTICILPYMFIYSTGPPPDSMHSVIHVHIFDWTTPWLYAFCYTCSYIRLDHPLTICILLYMFIYSTGPPPWLYAFCYTCSYIRLDHPLTICILLYMFIYSTGPPPDYMHSVIHVHIFDWTTPDYMHSIHVHIFDWTTPWLYAFCYIHVHIFDWTNPWLYAFCYTCSYIRLDHPLTICILLYMFIYSTGPPPDYMHSVIHVHIFDWTNPLTICILLYTCSYIRLDHPLTICILLYMFIYSTGPPPDYMHSVIHVHIFDWTTPWLYAFCYIHVHIFDWTNPWLYAFCYTCSYIRLDHPLTICILLYTCSYIRLDQPLTICILLYMFIYSTGPPPDYMHSVIHVHIFDWTTPWLYAFCYTCSYIRLDHTLTICILLYMFINSTGPPPDYMHSVIHVHIFDWTTPWLYAFCYTCSYIRLDHLLTICILLYMFIYSTGPPPDYMHSVIHVHIFDWTTPWLYAFCYTCSYIRLDHPLTICILLYTRSYIRLDQPPDSMHSAIHVHIFDWTTPWLYAFCYTCSYIRLAQPLTICILLYIFIYSTEPPPDSMHSVIHVHIFDWTTPWLYAFCYTCSYIRLAHPLTICILLNMFIYSTGPPPDYMHSVIHVHIFDWTTPWLYAFCYTCSYIRLDHPLTICILLYMFIYSTGPHPDYMHSVIHVHIFDWTTPWLYAFCYTCSYIRLDHPLTICILLYMFIYSTGPPPDYMHSVIHVHIFDWTTPWLYAFCYTCSYIRLDHTLTICILLYMFIYSTGPPPDYMHSAIHVHICDWTTPWLYAFCYTCSYNRLDHPLTICILLYAVLFIKMLFIRFNMDHLLNYMGKYHPYTLLAYYSHSGNPQGKISS